MQYPPPPQRPQAYRSRVAGLRQYVVQVQPAQTAGLRALLARSPSRSASGLVGAREVPPLRGLFLAVLTAPTAPGARGDQTLW
jgi:hypothetical protein